MNLITLYKKYEYELKKTKKTVNSRGIYRYKYNNTIVKYNNLNGILGITCIMFERTLCPFDCTNIMEKQRSVL